MIRLLELGVEQRRQPACEKPNDRKQEEQLRDRRSALFETCHHEVDSHD